MTQSCGIPPFIPNGISEEHTEITAFYTCFAGYMILGNDNTADCDFSNSEWINLPTCTGSYIHNSIHMIATATYIITIFIILPPFLYSGAHQVIIYNSAIVVYMQLLIVVHLL